ESKTVFSCVRAFLYAHVNRSAALLFQGFYVDFRGLDQDFDGCYGLGGLRSRDCLTTSLDGGSVAVRQCARASLATPSWSFGQLRSRLRQSDGRGCSSDIVVRASPPALGRLTAHDFCVSRPNSSPEPAVCFFRANSGQEKRGRAEA